MSEYSLTIKDLQAYKNHLIQEERSPATVENYLRDLERFVLWLRGRAVTKQVIVSWKGELQARSLTPSTVNAKLSALNGLFRFLGWDKCCVKFLKIQRRMFRDTSRELTKGDYLALLEAARSSGRERLALLMEAICSTGIRVGEVRYLTLEAAQAGRAEIQLKGKVRTILLPGKLCRKLVKYARRQKIASGEIFLTRNGNSLSRKQIWHEMKLLCAQTRVEPSKVFPHNLRHLFATSFYQGCRDIVRLADLLGHSSINTTRIYLQTTGAEHVRQLNKLGLIT